jgi:hypothetical protein
MRCRAGRLAGTRTLRLQQAERAGRCDRVVRGVPLGVLYSIVSGICHAMAASS